MAVPVLKLNLAPPPGLWSQHHRTISWACLALGAVAFAASAAVAGLAYRDAAAAGRETVTSTQGAEDLVQEQRNIQDRLQTVDVEKELPVWRLAERILGERSHPWSRLTAELERSLVQDVRLRSLQRARDAAQQVELRIRGEARSRAAEEAFVQSLQKNACFSQVILEREAERQGGGVEFEYTLALAAAPPAYAPLPKYGARKDGTAAVQVAPTRIPAAIAVPPPPAASAPRPIQPRIPQPGQPGKEHP